MNMAPWPKPVIITGKLEPNYLWHLMAVARIGYDSEYADNFRHTVNPEDLACLEDNKALLAFGEGEGGDLSGVFTTLPAWLGFENEPDLKSYFEIVQTALQQGNLTPFVEAYPEADWSDRFFAHYLKSAKFTPAESDLIEKSRRLSRVCVDNFDSYHQQVWPRVQPALARRAAELKDYFQKLDYVAKWEHLLGIPFAADQYEILLCYANKNGPDYNSISYSSNLFYYDKPLEKTCQFLSHEIGTHLLIDIYFDLAAGGRYEHRKLYAAYETMAMFLNKLILGTDELEYDLPRMNDKWHLKVYSEVYRKGMAPRDMILKALEQHE
ncbi:MAG: hypothetical protein ABII79_01710 [bacterium]